MIKFIQQQTTLRFDADPIVISSFSDDSVYATVRLFCADPTALVSVGVMLPGTPTLPLTQMVASPAAMRVNFQIPYAQVTATQVSASATVARHPTPLLPNTSGSIVQAVLRGDDDVMLVGSKCAAVIGDQLNAASRMTAVPVHTHEASIVIPLNNVAMPVRLTATAMNAGVAIAMIATEVSLLDRLSQLSGRIDDPTVSVRTVAGATVVLTDATQATPIDLYVREVGLTAELDTFVPLALGLREAELRFSRATMNAAILIAMRSDDRTGRSAGKRMTLASQLPDAPSARLIALRSMSGIDVNVNNIVNVDAVTVTRSSLGASLTLGPELVNSRTTLSFADDPGAGTYEYVAKLIGGTNVRVLPPVTVSLRGDPFTPRPLVANVITTTTNAGFVTKFDIMSPLQLGDASSAKTLIIGAGDAGLYANELQLQRSNYDPMPIFGVVRIDRDTGDTMDLGVVSSGTFSDTVPTELGLEHVRYVVSMALRDPLSLLPGTLAVITGSGTTYSYEPAVFRHPYALDGGTLVETHSRSLQHPELDSLVDATLTPSIVDVSFDQALIGAVSLTARRLSVSTVVIQIDDSSHAERDGYVVIAGYGDGTYELVGYVNALLTSTHRIYHDIMSVPASVTYGAAVLSKTLLIERFIVGPTVTLS